jgi:hypothetical protein
MELARNDEKVLFLVDIHPVKFLFDGGDIHT